MSSFPGSPKLLKGGLVLLDADSSVVKRVIVLQYNPDTLSRTLQVQATGGEGSDRSEALRIKGPPVETIKIDAEIDATDQLEFPDQNINATTYGVQPQLSALETILYPESGMLELNNILSNLGTIEIIPMKAPLVLFVWSQNRVLPVRLTDFSITEEAFDTSLNPIRAKVSLGMRVLSINDVEFSSKAGGLFMVHHQQKEQLAQKAPSGTLGALGLSGVP